LRDSEHTKQITYLLVFIASAIFFTILKVAATVIIPVILAVMLSFVMLPIVRKMNKIHLPWLFDVVVVTVLVVVCIAVIGTLIGASLRTIASQYGKYESKFLSIYEFIAERLNLKFDAGKSFFYNIQNAFDGQVDVSGAVKKGILSFSENIVSFVRNVLVIILMFIFLLVEIQLTGEKLNEAFEGKMKGRMMNIVRRTMTQVVRFLFIKFFISLATGILVYLTAKMVHLDFAVVWGFLAFVLNFIPTFGSIVSVVATSLFALLQFFPYPGPIIFVFAVTVTINMVLGNFIEPRIEGDNLGISPFVILVMLSLWGWMWGFVGMILAVPLTVIIKIICENIPLLHPVAILIGNKPQDTKMEISTDEKSEE
jgi:AI-2 transport protein TqsA